MDTNDLFNRQLGIVTPDELPSQITIIGAGGIGSWTAFCLAKMGARKIVVIDFDNVEDVNIAPQVFSMNDIGKNKAIALADFVNLNMGTPIIEPINSKWEDIPEDTKEDLLSNTEVLIMAVDSIDVRKMIWEDVQYAGLSLIIDGRMQKDLLEVLTLDPANEEQVEFYKTRLFPAEDVEEIPCTEKAVAYNQLVVAGLIGDQVKHYSKKTLEIKRIFFDLFSLTPIIN